MREPDHCRRCGHYVPGAGVDPLCELCAARNAFDAWFAGMGALVAPTDRHLLACAWNAALRSAWDTLGVGTWGGEQVKRLMVDLESPTSKDHE